MKINEFFGRLTEVMSRTEALRVFADHGVDAATLDARGLQRARKRLAKIHHPDSGGELAAMQAINVAFDTLMRASAGAAEPPEPSRPRSRPAAGRRDTAVPPWAWAGYSGGLPPNASIYRQDFSDVNYFKKRMWELSGKSRQEWTIWNFDGRYCRGVVSVFGTPKIFPQMAEAMRQWDRFYHSRAIFVTRKGQRHKLWLIWSDGETRDPPIEVEDDSFNANPFNDQSFTRGLPAWLDRIRDADPH